MDDCLAQVAIDFGGRNWIVWDAEFKREMIGEMPTEMFFHFFKSFSRQGLVQSEYQGRGHERAPQDRGDLQGIRKGDKNGGPARVATGICRPRKEFL